MTVHKSPSGRYELQIENTPTKPGCWNYTVGTVKRSSEVIGIVKRNYSSFPYLFVEDHPNGHDYLVAGENYQGQTVIELDTGKRRDFLPEAAKQGHGFCWVEYSYHSEQKMLVVCGCIWACPYEYRFYDFSDPMSGWLGIGEDICIDADGKEPEVSSDGTIKCFETRIANEDSDDEEDIREVVATKTYRREGSSLVLVEEWIDEQEKVRRTEAKAAQEKWEREWEEYKRTDPLYLRVNASMTGEYLKDWDVSVGGTYAGWCPHYSGDDDRVCVRISRNKSAGVSIDLEWGRREAPVKLVIYRDGKHVEDKWYEHSVEGIEKALSYVQEVRK